MRKFIHIDMDCFFAAIEMREDPSLRNIPLAIGGSVDDRGVISTANYIAREYGVHSAMSTAMALKRCPQLKILPGRMDFYESVSQRIHEIFSRYTSLIEPVSLDEAYLDLTGSEYFHGSATLIAEDIRRSIFSETNLTASAGVSSVKFLAKIASDINKPDGIFCIAPENVDDFLRVLPVRKIPGVGPKTEERLLQMGFRTCADVQASDIHIFLREFGKFGEMIWERCHGIDENEICVNPIRKTVGVEVTLPKDIHQWDACGEVITSLFPELFRRLHGYSIDGRIKRQGVKFKFNDFQLTVHDRTCQLLDLSGLLNAAKYVWDHRRKKRGVRLVGIHAALPDEEQCHQLRLQL